MFKYKNIFIEKNLRLGLSENKPIADVLQTTAPQYLSDLKTALISTMLNQSVIYFTNMYDINALISQMSAAQCKEFRVSNVNGIGPQWSGLIVKKNSIWFNELNNLVTDRMTRATGR
jgi:hypothetical protein